MIGVEVVARGSQSSPRFAALRRSKKRVNGISSRVNSYPGWGERTASRPSWTLTSETVIWRTE